MMTDKMKTPSKCRVCGSSELIWFTLRNSVDAQDGRLRMPEIAQDFILGCKGCSETLRVLRADDVVEYLARLRASTTQQPTEGICENSPKPTLGEDTVFGRLYYQATDYLALQGEVQRLQDALTRIAGENYEAPHDADNDYISGRKSACITRMRGVARAALAARTGQEVGK